ncbi:hypothetical protein TNCV_3967611 [Trichonephila clavipes]|nr:hypothetical protein TNCV_3967611 [Trichonephila clavipes]
MKKELLKAVDQKQNMKTEICKDFGIGDSILSTIIKKESKLLKFLMHIYVFLKLNSVAQQPMKAKGYCAQLSIRDFRPEENEQMFRSGGQPDAKPPVLSSQTSLVLIYQPIEGIKG